MNRGLPFWFIQPNLLPSIQVCPSICRTSEYISGCHLKIRFSMQQAIGGRNPIYSGASLKVVIVSWWHIHPKASHAACRILMNVWKDIKMCSPFLDIWICFPVSKQPPKNNGKNDLLTPNMCIWLKDVMNPSVSLLLVHIHTTWCRSQAWFAGCVISSSSLEQMKLIKTNSFHLIRHAVYIYIYIKIPLIL